MVLGSSWQILARTIRPRPKQSVQDSLRSCPDDPTSRVLLKNPIGITAPAEWRLSKIKKPAQTYAL